MRGHEFWMILLSSYVVNSNRCKLGRPLPNWSIWLSFLVCQLFHWPSQSTKAVTLMSTPSIDNMAGMARTHTHTHIINVFIHCLPWLCSCEMTILKQHWQECSWAGGTFTPLGSARWSICQHWVRRSATVVCISIVTLTIPICLYLYFQRLHLPCFCLRSPSSAAFWKLKPGLPTTWSKSTVANMQSSWLWPPVCCSRRCLNFTLHVDSCSISSFLEEVHRQRSSGTPPSSPAPLSNLASPQTHL